MAANFDDEQKRMAGAQADIAELMSQLMQMRSALTTPTAVGPPGQQTLQGPMVEALQAALGNQMQRQQVPRMRLQATPFNPFGGAPPDMERAPQMFGPSSGPAVAPPPLQAP